MPTRMKDKYLTTIEFKRIESRKILFILNDYLLQTYLIYKINRLRKNLIIFISSNFHLQLMYLIYFNVKLCNRLSNVKLLFLFKNNGDYTRKIV